MKHSTRPTDPGDPDLSHVPSNSGKKPATLPLGSAGGSGLFKKSHRQLITNSFNRLHPKFSKNLSINASLEGLVHPPPTKMTEQRPLQMAPGIPPQANLFLKQKQTSDSKKDRLGEHNFFYKGHKPTEGPVGLAADIQGPLAGPTHGQPLRHQALQASWVPPAFGHQVLHPNPTRVPGQRGPGYTGSVSVSSSEKFGKKRRPTLKK